MIRPLACGFVAAVALAAVHGRPAIAQPVEDESGHKFAPPSDETPPPGEAEELDPSKHFNFFGFDYRDKDELGGPYGDGVMVDPETHEQIHEEEHMSPPFVLMALNFGVLLGLLAWKGRPVARQLAAERHDQIKSALDEAAKLRKQAADKLAEYEARLREADTEIKQLVDGMRADAEADKVRILEAADRQSKQLAREAEQRIAAEIELARATLTREVTAAAAAATEKLLRDKLDGRDQQKLVATFIADLGTGPGAPGSKEAR